MLTLQQYIRTQEGQAMIESQGLFAIEDQVYQGFKGTVVLVDERQLTDDEIERVADIDQKSMKAVLAARESRLAVKLAETRKEERERRMLELAEQERELQVEELLEKRKQRLAMEAEQPTMYACPECDKEFDDPAKLAGHKVGAHSKRKSA